MGNTVPKDLTIEQARLKQISFPTLSKRFKRSKIEIFVNKYLLKIVNKLIRVRLK